MKKLVLIPLIAVVIGLFQACSSNKSSSSSDSITTTTDTSKMTSNTKDSTVMAVNPDTAFANKACIGGMAEVALGKLALTKTSSAKIKDFANMMVTDHSKINDELMAIAKTKGITLPATVDAEHQKKIDDLTKLSGSDFDKAYVTAMLGGHKKVLALLQDEAKNGKDAELKAFAAKTAVVVQMHLDAITKINNSMK